MNDDDLKNCFAMFILGGKIMRDDFIEPHAIWRLAEEMVREKNNFDDGIVAIRKKKYVRKNES
jgi:hypothetical protein